MLGVSVLVVDDILGEGGLAELTVFQPGDRFNTKV